MTLCSPWIFLAVGFLVLIAAQALPSSTIECDGSPYRSRFCVLTNAYVWEGHVYLLSEGDLELPAVRMDTFHSSEYNANDPQLENFVSVLHPDALPFGSLNAITTYAYGGAWMRTLINNWYHTFTEDSSNWAARFCKGMGLCSWDSFHGPGKETIMLFLDKAGPAMGNFGDLHSCWGRWKVLSLTGAAEVIHIRRLLVGVGSECNPPHCHGSSEGLMQPLSAETTANWIQFMRSCARLPEQAPLHTSRPQVLFANRAFASGRSIINMGEVYANFTERKPKYPNATFKYVYLEGMDWREAAALFAESDIVVFPHGAQTSSATFMPMRSEIVHVSHTESHSFANTAIVQNLALYLQLGEQAIVLNSERDVYLNMEKLVNDYKGLESFTTEDLNFMLRHHACPVHAHADCPDGNLFSRYLNYNVPGSLLAAKVEAAIARWHDKRRSVSERRLHRARRRHGAGHPQDPMFGPNVAASW